MLWDIQKSVEMMKVTSNKLLTLLNVRIKLRVSNTCIISEERCQGLQTWILDSFRELHDVQAQRLAIAGVIVEEIRNNIYKETGFRCSAGIAQNKVYILHILCILLCITHFKFMHIV